MMSARFYSENTLRRLTPRRIFVSVLRHLGWSPKFQLPRGTPWTTRVDVAVICPAYPGKDTEYGGQFVQSRVMAYMRAGLSVVVITSREDCLEDSIECFDDVPVWRTNPLRLGAYLKNNLCRRVVLHHPEKENWAAVKQNSERTRPLLIFHGYEARPWRTLKSSYTAEDLATLTPLLDARDLERRKTLQDIFKNPHSTPIFVSQMLRETAEAFSNYPTPAHTEIIHNPVLSSEFPYREKQAFDRYSILWMRSFRSYNYANDLSRDTILALSTRPDFDKFKITIYGDGDLWDEITEPLSVFENVTLRRGTVPRLAVSQLHSQNGIMLVPSRWESQGLTLCESMSSGLVAITTAVAAVPEFISDQEGRVCKPESPAAMAEAIGGLIDDPNLFQKLSKAAGLRSQAQCGLNQTVTKEIKLLRI